VRRIGTAPFFSAVASHEMALPRRQRPEVPILSGLMLRQRPVHGAPVDLDRRFCLPALPRSTPRAASEPICDHLVPIRAPCTLSGLAPPAARRLPPSTPGPRTHENEITGAPGEAWLSRKEDSDVTLKVGSETQQVQFLPAQSLASGAVASLA